MPTRVSAKKYKKPFLSKILFKKKPRLRSYARQYRFKSILSWVMALIVALALGYGIYYVFVRTNFLRVSSIEVEGAKNFVNAEDLKNVAREYALEKNILFVNSKVLSERLLSSFQGARAIQIVKRIPNKVIIQVTERIPLALVFGDSDKDYFMIDKDGYVLGAVDPTFTNLPQIAYSGEIKVGDFIDRSLVPLYLELVAILEEEPLHVSSMSFYPDYVELYLDDGASVLLGKDKNIKESVKFVMELVRQLGSQSKKAQRIDLRYDKVIVSY